MNVIIVVVISVYVAFEKTAQIGPRRQLPFNGDGIDNGVESFRGLPITAGGRVWNPVDDRLVPCGFDSVYKANQIVAKNVTGLICAGIVVPQQNLIIHHNFQCIARDRKRTLPLWGTVSLLHLDREPIEVSFIGSFERQRVPVASISGHG